jgi:hypothetical protein
LSETALSSRIAHRRTGNGGGDLGLITVVFLFLTLLVWGLFALDRGMWQDDVLCLSSTRMQPTQLARFLSPITSPTRVLIRIPYALALLTLSPVTTLQMIYGAVWLLSGALVAIILLEMFPRRRWLAYLGGCLTICSTGDFLTDSLVALHYEVSAVCFFAALFFLLKSWRSDSILWMLPSAVLLSWSIWTSDAAFASVILTPALLWLLVGRRFDRRPLAIMSIWYAVFIPYFIAFLKFLRDPQGYAVRAMVPASLRTRLGRTAQLFLHNFDIWSWGPGRRNWFAALPRMLPLRLCVVLALLGTAAFLLAGLRIRTSSGTGPPAGVMTTGRLLQISGCCLVMGLGSNATFALVQFSEVFYRTQIMSRYWVSIAIAIAVYAVAGVPWLRWTEVVIPTLFVGFGIYGGLDRQDYYLGYWRQHRQELRSILGSVPRLNADGVLVLHLPERHSYMATDAEYLAKSWLALLYEDPSFRKRTVLWSTTRQSRCTAPGSDLVCWGDRNTPPAEIPINRVVLLTYRVAENRFVLADREFVSHLLGPQAAQNYSPSAEIVPGPYTPLARSLLSDHPGLERFLPMISSGQSPSPRP